MTTRRSKTKRRTALRSAQLAKSRKRTAAKCGAYIAYFRVSSTRRGKELETQRAAVRAFLASRACDPKPIAEFAEEEPNQLNRRPELEKAIDLAHRTDAFVVFARVEDLLRNAAFLTMLRDSPRDLEYRCADMPELDRSTLAIFAKVAEGSRERTRAALAAARKRGIKFGNPAGGHAFSTEDRKRGNKKSIMRIKSAAADVAESLAPTLDKLRKDGFTSATDIARELNRRNVPSPSDQRRVQRKEKPLGIAWHPQMVIRVLSKLAEN